MIRYLFVFIFMIILTSCSHFGKQDGPPGFYVDETKIPNAKPKAEPLAKYGNYKSYVVNGKRYYTLLSSRDYVATGIASWYGTKFHSHRTSSGEPYDMLGMTAAHKTLPLPTYVRVTNLKNARTIVVKVNDRGPFESNRLIDLSYVAAKKLGMTGHGTAHVRVEAIDPRESLSPNTIYLQLGAFRNKANAERFRTQLASTFYEPITAHPPGFHSHLYRVAMGPFETTATANQLLHQLKEIGIDAKKLEHTA